jgi:site-specific DNA-methyltransferase (adenine-specific)
MVNDTEERIRQKITAPSTEQAKEWDGWGSALKPAVEPIVLARKPLEKGLSIADNVLKWGTGAINIDGCRVTTNDNLNGGAYSENKKSDGEWGTMHEFVGKEYEQPQGRFPANLILTHHPDCECIGTKKVKPSNGSGKASENGGGFSKGMFGDGTSDNIGGGFTDANGEETVEDWNCVDDCPIKILDEQSGESKSNKRGAVYNKPTENSNIYTPAASDYRDDNTYADKGGASRFFYTPKTSKSERNWGLEDFEETISSDRKAIHNVGANNPRNRSGKPKANIHPTVKPVKLMQYLARLITPPNGLVLDPFNGSGTTGIACKLEGFDYIGLEISEEYCEIARGRIESWDDELEYMMELKIKEIEREQKKDASQLNLF